MWTDEERAAGSSPLTRGKLGGAVKEGAGKGLIPAHAGKTVIARSKSSGRGGSSPLTRGKRPNAADRLQGDGLIPAHAGKTAAG